MTRANKQTWTMRSSYSRGMRGTKKEETFLGEKLIPRANACQEYDFHSNRILLKIYQVLPSFGKRNLHAIERERERGKRRRKKKKEKKRSKDYSTPFLQPLNDAKKDAVQDSCGDRRPGPIWPVSIEIRTCASRPRRRL